MVQLRGKSFSITETETGEIEIGGGSDVYAYNGDHKQESYPAINITFLQVAETLLQAIEAIVPGKPIPIDLCPLQRANRNEEPPKIA